MKIIDYLGLKESHNPMKAIVIHHAMAVKASVYEVDDWHKDNGWKYIGYAEYIEKDGTVYLCRKDNVQAANYKYNRDTYNICLEGDYNKEANIPEEQFDALVNRIKSLKQKYPDAAIRMHRDYGNTESCPGKLFPIKDVINAVNSDVEEELDYEDILIKVSKHSGVWIQVVNELSEIKYYENDVLSNLEIFEEIFKFRGTLEYLPLLIEKIYKQGIDDGKK